MRRQDDRPCVTYHFENLAVEGLTHAVFTRRGGVSQGPFATLNVGNSVGDDEAAVAENHRRVYAHLGLAASQVVSPWQVHSNRVAIVSGHDAGQVLPNTDGLVTATPGVALLLRFADCQPILLYDPEHHALALIHAGWRGVAQGIALRAIEALRAAFGSRPQALVAGLGPAIGPCCYTVGDEVAAAMGYALPDWSKVMHAYGTDHWRFDLEAANAQQLDAAGVQNVERAALCTSCHSDEFYSHRGNNGQTGRFAVVAFLSLRTAGPEQEAGQAAPVGESQAAPPWTGDSLAPPGLPSFQEAMEAVP